MKKKRRYLLLSCLMLFFTSSTVCAELLSGKDIANSGNGKGAPPCIACHSPTGEGNAIAGFPVLNGLHATYLRRQLMAFKAGGRDNATMKPIADALTFDNIEAVSAYYASLSYKPNGAAAKGANLTVGADLAAFGDWTGRGLPACNQCHGIDGRGVGAIFPRLAGQDRGYLENAFKNWRSGERKEAAFGLMTSIADKLSAQEIEDVTSYYAALRLSRSALKASDDAFDHGNYRITPDAPSAASGEKSKKSPIPAINYAAYFKPPLRADLPDNKFGESVARGQHIFTNTDTSPRSKDFVGNRQQCANCHLDAGRLAYSGPLWAAWVAYPAYRSKNKRVNSMAERIQGCFTYSMNAGDSKAGKPPALDDDAIQDLISYAYWLAKGAPTGDKKMPGRGFGAGLHETAAGFSPTRGKVVYEATCSLCHGLDGRGLISSGDLVFPALWGDRSYNWGAGMHRVNTAADFIKHNMPLGLPLVLSDQDAWDVAAYINAQPRPQDPRYNGNFKETAEKYHKGKFDYYGRYKLPNGKLLGEE